MKIAINALLLKEDRLGVSNYIYNLIYGLSKICGQDEFTIFVNKRDKFTEIDSNNRFLLRRVGILDRISYTRVFWEQLFMPKILKDLKVDVFHSPSFILPPNLPCKSVLTVHDLSYLKLPRIYPNAKQAYYQYFVKASILRADKIIAVSENTKQDIVCTFRIPSEKIKVIYYGLDSIYRRLEKEELDEGIKRFNLPEKFILYVGTIEPRKNLGRLIMAFSRVRKSIAGYKLLIAGPKIYRYQGIFNLVSRLKLENEVIFTGYLCREYLLVLYNAASIFIYPSLYEGFGLSVIEAMACGVPVITSNNSSLKEIASDNALLVDPYNIKELSEAIRLLLKNDSLRNNFIQRGLAKIKEFNWQNNALITKGLYEQILAN